MQYLNGNRCMLRENRNQCTAKHYVIDSQLNFTLIRNDQLTGVEKVKNPVQLRPQRATLTNVRVGNKLQLCFTTLFFFNYKFNCKTF